MFLPSSFASNIRIGSVFVDITIPSFCIIPIINPGFNLLLKNSLWLLYISSIVRILILIILRFFFLNVVLARGYKALIFL